MPPPKVAVSIQIAPGHSIPPTPEPRGTSITSSSAQVGLGGHAVDQHVVEGEAGVEGGEVGEHPEPQRRALGNPREFGDHGGVDLAGLRLDGGPQVVPRGPVEAGVGHGDGTGPG